MRNPRYLLAGRIHFITFRTQEGLPFVPLEFMNTLLRSALARAQKLYPTTIICFVIQANHVHLLIRVTNPEDVSRFIGYFKAESAHYLNRLLDRRQRSVWVERFDSPAVLDIDKALELFAYCTLNPVKDRLVSHMRDYPGVSSYSALLNNQRTIPAKSIPRDKVPALPDPHNPQKYNRELSNYFESDEFEDLFIVLSPDELRLAFSSTVDGSSDDFRIKLLETIKRYENLFTANRNGGVLGVRKLLSASLLQTRKPPIRGKRMICLSSHRHLRQLFIRTFMHIKALCQEAYRRWKAGDVVPYPPGMFAPHMPRIASLVA